MSTTILEQISKPIQTNVDEDGMKKDNINITIKDLDSIEKTLTDKENTLELMLKNTTSNRDVSTMEEEKEELEDDGDGDEDEDDGGEDDGGEDEDEDDVDEDILDEVYDNTISVSGNDLEGGVENNMQENY